MKKKLMNIVVSLGIILGSVGIAGGIFLFFVEPSESECNKGRTAVDWSCVTDNPDRTLEISIQGMPTSRGSDGSWIQHNLEQRFNIRIKPYFFDMNAFCRKRPLILASGDIPDVMWDGDPLNVRNNVRNNFIMEVPYEIILKYAPNYVKMLNAGGKEAWLYSWYANRNYGLPTFSNEACGPRFGSWRKDWLTNIGWIGTPDTVEEMEEVLRRFRYNDPDGNGKKDTYGLSLNISHWSLAYSEVFAAFDILPFDFMRVDGRIVWGGILPECKEVLALLHRWYKEELIDPDFIIDTQGVEQRVKFLNGKIGYMYAVDMFSDYDADLDGSLANSLRELCNGTMVPAKPLKSRKDGRRHARSWGGAAHVMQFGAHLCHCPEKIIRYLKMMDAICQEERLYVETRCGQMDGYWTFLEGKGIRIRPEYKDDVVLAREMIVPGGFGCNMFFPSNLFLQYNINYISHAHRAFFETYQRVEWSMTNVLGKSDILPSSSRYLENLRVLQQQIYAKIIIGELPLDAFDAFVRKWNARGGRILEKEANEMYGTMLRIYRKVGVKNEN